MPLNVAWKPFVRYIWPLRVPVFGAATIVGLPWLAFYTPARPFLSGLFDPVDTLGLALITALALFNAWTVVIISGLILRYGSVRLGLPVVTLNIFPVRWTWWAASGLVLAGPVVARTATYAGRFAADRWLSTAGAVVLGAGVAFLFFYLALWIDNRLKAREGKEGRLDSAYLWLLNAVARSPFFACGFLVTPAGEIPALAPGHGLAFGLACSSVGLYIATGFLTRDIQRPELASALAYVLLLVLMLTWIAGVAAFLFDRIRVPLVLLLAGWILVVSNVIEVVFTTDHIYRTVDLQPDAPALAATAHLFDRTPTPIVVAASGGGIQAAAWTTRVLTALDGIAGFRGNLRLVSAVSGGSVGTMNLLASWPDCGPPIEPADVVSGGFDANAASRASSLHAVGWGLVFKDLPRTIAPFFSNPYVDRGSVLEDAWKREPRLQRAYPDPAPFLASWRRNVAEHRCPAVAFNAMVAETGEPMLFSTAALPASLAPFAFYEHYPGRDLPISTAVRLSAAFPYVSAAARADRDDVERRGYAHLVDGGYFDNYGVGTLAAMTHATLGSMPPLAAGARRLLVIEICDAVACSGQESPARPAVGGDRRAWPYQIVAPFSALVAMRSAAQRVTNRTTLRLLTDDWRTRDTCIEMVPVPFGAVGAPMSWHLTTMEKQRIDDTWKDMSNRTIAAVSAYLAGGAATPDGEKCLSEVAMRQSK
jgi:hypothetical protein